MDPVHTVPTVPPPALRTTPVRQCQHVGEKSPAGRREPAHASGSEAVRLVQCVVAQALPTQRADVDEVGQSQAQRLARSPQHVVEGVESAHTQEGACRMELHQGSVIRPVAAAG